MLKKIILPLAAALSLGCIVASAQNIKSLEGSKYSITAGDLTLTVDAGQGAKILLPVQGQGSPLAAPAPQRLRKHLLDQSPDRMELASGTRV